MNDVVQQPTSELLNETYADDFDDSWLHCNDCFQKIPMKDTSTLNRAYGIINYLYIKARSYAQYQFTNVLTFFEP